MGVVPDTRVGKIEFYEAHISPWTTNAAGIGLTPASVTALGTLTATARDKYNDAEAARQAAKAATLAFHDAVRAMHSGPGASGQRDPRPCHADHEPAAARAGHPGGDPVPAAYHQGP
jgi:hypothetical protein